MVIELMEYDIKFEPRKAMKTQALTDFIVELPQGVEEAEYSYSPL